MLTFQIYPLEKYTMLIKGRESAVKIALYIKALRLKTPDMIDALTMEYVTGIDRASIVKETGVQPATMSRRVKDMEELDRLIDSIVKLNGRLLTPVPAPFPVPAPISPAPVPTPVSYDSEEQVMSINEAKRRKEVSLMLISELALAKEREQVANIDDLMQEFEDALINIRAKLVSMPSRLSGILSHQDEDGVSKLLNSDVRDMLEMVSEYE